MESYLTITGVTFPPFSCRDITQILCPVSQGEMRRTVNGELCFVGSRQHFKYTSTVMGHDDALPGFQQAWIGAQVRVGCISTLTEEIRAFDEAGAPLLSRAVVPGSLKIDRAGDGEAQSCTARYRPMLDMRITGFQFCDGEWEKGARWRLDLEEI